MGMQFTVHNSIGKESIIPPAIILAAVLLYHLIFDREIVRHRNTFIVAIPLVIFTAFYALNINSSMPFKTEYISYLLIIVSLFIAILFFKNSIIEKNMWILFVFFYGNLLFLPMLLGITNFNAANSNGIIAFILLFFCLINLKNKNMVFRSINIYNTILLVVTLFTATSRTAMMAFFIVVVVFFAIKYLHKYTFYLTTAIILISPIVTGIYIYLKSSPIGESINNLSLQVTGKNFFSGRDRIWNEAMDTVFQNGMFWTGLGNNYQFPDLGGYLHNLYVQVFYQSGILGFVLVGILLMAISYVIGRATVVDYDFRILFGYFIAILFLQVFEGHLIYKFEIISVLFWVTIALLIRKSSQTLDSNNEATMGSSYLNDQPISSSR